MYPRHQRPQCCRKLGKIQAKPSLETQQDGSGNLCWELGKAIIDLNQCLLAPKADPRPSTDLPDWPWVGLEPAHGSRAKSSHQLSLSALPMLRRGILQHCMGRRPERMTIMSGIMCRPLFAKGSDRVRVKTAAEHTRQAICDSRIVMECHSARRRMHQPCSQRGRHALQSLLIIASVRPASFDR